MGYAATVKMDDGTIVIAEHVDDVIMSLWQHYESDLDVELSTERARDLATKLIAAADAIDSRRTKELQDNDSLGQPDKGRSVE